MQGLPVNFIIKILVPSVKYLGKFFRRRFLHFSISQIAAAHPAAITYPAAHPPKGLYSLDIFGEQYKIKVMQRCPENQTFTHV